MTSPAPYQPGDRVALVATDDPGTRLRPGDQGTVTRWDPRHGQLDVKWDSGSTLSMLPGEGDQVRLLARAAGEDGTEPRPRRPRGRRASPGMEAGHHRPGYRPEQAAVRAVPDLHLARRRPDAPRR